MSWWRFEKDKDNEKKSLSIFRLKHMQVCCYDMRRNGDCFDETFIYQSPEGIYETFKDLGMNLTYVETEESNEHLDRFRVFVCFDNDDIYELKMEKLSKEQFSQCNNFFGGR